MEVDLILFVMFLYSLGCVGFIWSKLIDLLKIESNRAKYAALIAIVAIGIGSFYGSFRVRVDQELVQTIILIPIMIIWISPVLYVGFRGFHKVIKSMKGDEE